MKTDKDYADHTRYINILFLSLLDFKSLRERNIYTDLLREFQRNGHRIYVISPVERRQHQKTRIIREKGAVILKLRTGNMQKVNRIEKGVSTVAIGPQFVYAVKKYFGHVKFGLVLYATPPITFCGVVEFIKKRDGARSYLLLKDIFPQNALDMGMLGRNGIKGLVYRYFRTQEQRMYRISDRIGCMSPANTQYLLTHNPEVSRTKVELAPNSVEAADKSITAKEREQIRKKYDIPKDRTVYVCGGNLGKPQGIPFMLRCLHSQRKNDKVFFLIVGNGTEYPKILQYIKNYRPENVMLRQWLPREDYDKLVAACDVGMIFLDHRFTIPNFPSRMLGYMQAKLPVLAVTDTASDIGKIIVEGKFGWWCGSDNVEAFDSLIKRIRVGKEIREASFRYLCAHYTVEETCKNMNWEKSV